MSLIQARGAEATAAADAAATAVARAKQREYIGFYRGVRASNNGARGALSSMLGRLGGGLGGLFRPKVYESWTDEQIVPTTAFAAVEWACVGALFQEYQATFVGSRGHRRYLDHLDAEAGAALPHTPLLRPSTTPPWCFLLRPTPFGPYPREPPFDAHSLPPCVCVSCTSFSC